MIKYKKGIAYNLSEGTWALMNEKQRAEFSDEGGQEFEIEQIQLNEKQAELNKKTNKPEIEVIDLNKKDKYQEQEEQIAALKKQVEELQKSGQPATIISNEDKDKQVIASKVSESKKIPSYIDGNNNVPGAEDKTVPKQQRKPRTTKKVSNDSTAQKD